MRKMSDWLDGISRLQSITGTQPYPSAPGDR